jgi:hypothetical protein
MKPYQKSEPVTNSGDRLSHFSMYTSITVASTLWPFLEETFISLTTGNLVE